MLFEFDNIATTTIIGRNAIPRIGQVDCLCFLLKLHPILLIMNFLTADLSV